MLRGTDSILWNIPPFMLNVKNILQNYVNPTEHYYESEYCYDSLMPFFPLDHEVDISLHLTEAIALCTSKESASLSPS